MVMLEPLNLVTLGFFIGLGYAIGIAALETLGLAFFFTLRHLSEHRSDG